MEKKYRNMSHNYKIITQAGRMMESYRLQEKIKNKPSQLITEGTIEKYDEDSLSSTIDSELISNDSTIFNNSEDDIVNTTNINLQNNINNQNFTLNDETFLEIMSYAVEHLSNKLYIANDKPQQYRSNITSDIRLFKKVIEDFKEDIRLRGDLY